MFFSGCAGQEISTPAPVSTPTGHEQAGEPDMSYLGLADVFSGKTMITVSAANVDVDIEGVRLSGFLV